MAASSPSKIYILHKSRTTLSNDRTKQVSYTQPEGERLLREKLANWEHWMHGTLPGTAEIDPLVRMAASHYQYEAINPFTDGNGRTGRVVNLLYIVEQGLPDIPVLYLSRHILRNKAAYYSGLQSITETGAWEPWLLYMLTGVTETASWTMNKIVTVRGRLEEATERMRRDASQIYFRELAELVFVRPYCRISHVVGGPGQAPDRQHLPQGACGDQHLARAQDGPGEDLPHLRIH